MLIMGFSFRRFAPRAARVEQRPPCLRKSRFVIMKELSSFGTRAFMAATISSADLSCCAMS